MNSDSEFITENNLTEQYNNIKVDTMYNGEFKEDQVQTVNITAPVAVNEDIPSFREWTKKHLEEAEKQPGMKNYCIQYLSDNLIHKLFYLSISISH